MSTTIKIIAGAAATVVFRGEEHQLGENDVKFVKLNKGKENQFGLGM